uniref:Dehydration-responsive element-binding protein 1D n=1 Tax=Chimonanthus praecox TaxID=13419 RepID=A0A4Y5QZD4_9MAGN|nr:dehydration-responsive element-binding protein 1D [Chimonanthus praecox]
MEKITGESSFQQINVPEHSSPTYTSSHQGNSEEDAFATVATSPPKRRAGRTKFKETRHPVYKGVRQRNGSKWVCEVREPNKKSRIWLGTFPTAEMAARAHDVAAMALRGRSACLNFADSAWILPVPESGNTKDIQRAAAKAAEAFRPRQSDEATSDWSSVKPENSTLSLENLSFTDEEEALNMPGLLANMAEGMLLPPPPCLETGSQWDDLDFYADVSLWSYSI